MNNGFKRLGAAAALAAITTPALAGQGMTVGGVAMMVPSTATNLATYNNGLQNSTLGVSQAAQNTGFGSAGNALTLYNGMTTSNFTGLQQAIQLGRGYAVNTANLSGGINTSTAGTSQNALALGRGAAAGNQLVVNGTIVNSTVTNLQQAISGPNVPAAGGSTSYNNYGMQ